METVYIRVDMNPTIATGHVMRCLSIADEIKALGGNAVFIVADEYPVENIRKRGYESIILQTDWKKMEEELPKLKSYIEKLNIKKILVDSYQVTKTYLETLKAWVHVTYLDDVDAFAYPVDSLICYANYYQNFSYGVNKGKKGYYLGTEYVPLRKVFQKCPAKNIKNTIEKILLLSGGTDSFGITEGMLEKFKCCEETEIVIVCGKFFEGYNVLKERYRNYKNLHFYQNVADLEVYMQEADLAISAGGTTLYELCATGTPTISYSFADNQLYNVKEFSKEKLIPYAGDVRYEDIFSNAYALYQRYDKDCGLRKDCSLKMQKIVDGKGAIRIAETLL